MHICLGSYTNSSIIMGLALLIQNQLYKYLCKKYIEPRAPWLMLINQQNQVNVLGISFHQTMIMKSLLLMIISSLTDDLKEKFQIKLKFFGIIMRLTWIIMTVSLRQYQKKRVAKILPSWPSIPLEDYPIIIEASF